MTFLPSLLVLFDTSGIERFFADNATGIVRVILLLVIGLPLVWFLAGAVGNAMRSRTTDQTAMIVRKVVLYFGVIIIFVSTIHQLGFQLTALLGAAGIVGIAIGFASQTSVSNIISGFFLIAEKPFAVGDLVKVGNTTGIVLSIDLLSLKLRTFDNQFIRIPNETIMKTELTNITRFPLRRVDTTISVAYKEDLDRVREILLDLARLNPAVLDEPEPVILLNSYANSGIDFLYAVWCVKTDYVEVRKTLVPAIKKRFDEEGIEIPFPHVSLYAGAETAPFPIRLVDNSLPTTMPPDSGDGAGI